MIISFHIENSINNYPFTTQDADHYCENTYNNKDNKIIKYVLPSPDKISSFCHSQGFKYSYITTYNNYTGIKCFTVKGDITKSHYYKNKEINMIYKGDD